MTYSESQFEVAKYLSAQVPYINDLETKKRAVRSVLNALREFLIGD
jgi:hypothetical protein